MKALVKILAVFGAIAAVAALLYHFREKLMALCPCCKKDNVPVTDEPAEEQDVLVEETPVEAEAEAEAETAEAVAEEAAEEAAETVTAEDFAE